MLELNKIYNMDCLDGLRLIDDQSIDAVITDPPYGINYQSQWIKDKNKRQKPIKNDKKPFIWFLHDAFRILKPGGYILCFCRWDVEYIFTMALNTAGFDIKSEIIWDREIHGMGDLHSSFAPMHDNILFATKGKYKFPNKRPKSIIRAQRISGEQLIHPNEKPLALMQELITSTSCENDIILDPFIGSGTTAVAAKSLNRNYLGFEINPEYVEIANNRLSTLSA